MENERVSVWEWLWTMIIASIPIVGIIFLIVTSLASKKQSKRTYAIAMIILTVIGLVFTFAFSKFLLGWLNTAMSGLGA